ncbi:MAG: hypothetical protein JST01_17735 [Cyanobacteria bacterium SZAS TMP-1]|nr:hypothetical protein [Cyanobacteria bacterium SZAS TMP-1]
MRFILALFFIAIFLIVGFTALKISPDEDTPVKYARRFLNSLQDGDYQHAVGSFGGNICRCPADLGWVSYLIYGSAEEPNLAFMMGKRFIHSSITFKKLEIATDKSKQTPFEKPQDYEVDIPISFEPSIYAPMFLPLDMAYGLPMKSTDLNAFLADPDKDSWKGLTLRLRPSLAPGTVAIPADAKMHIDSYIRDKKRREKEERELRLKKEGGAQESPQEAADSEAIDNEATAAEKARELAKTALTESLDSKYLVPKDAAEVVGEDGKAISSKDLEARLPRLKAALLKLHMVRRDPTQPFTVFHFVVSDPVLAVPTGNEFRQVILKNFKPPM